MRAAVFNGPRSIEVADRPDPIVKEPTGAVGYATDLEHMADAYEAMDERRAIKSLVRVGSL